jgi:hypothetical protein
VLARLYCNGSLTCLTALGQLRDELGHMQPLNLAVQTFLRGLSAHSRKRNGHLMLDQASLPWFVELNRALGDSIDPAAFRQRLQDTGRLLRQLATEIAERAELVHPGSDTTALRAAIERAGGAVRGEPMLFPALQDEPEAQPA